MGINTDQVSKGFNPKPKQGNATHFNGTDTVTGAAGQSAQHRQMTAQTAQQNAIAAATIEWLQGRSIRPQVQAQLDKALELYRTTGTLPENELLKGAILKAAEYEAQSLLGGVDSFLEQTPDGLTIAAVQTINLDSIGDSLSALTAPVNRQLMGNTRKQLAGG